MGRGIAFRGPALGVSETIEGARRGGLSGSTAGLCGSAMTGPGVDGVDWEAHLVPKPLVRAAGVAAAGVCGAAAGLGRLTAGVAAA